jgi:hypothetical protein
MNTEKGMRNFIAATNHMQYRTRALLLRSIKTTNAAAAATIVDCQT